jgi:hypothetical protein
MSVRVCDRCGDITLNGEGCTCATPRSAAAIGPPSNRRASRPAAVSTRPGSSQADTAPPPQAHRHPPRDRTRSRTGRHLAGPRPSPCPVGTLRPAYPAPTRYPDPAAGHRVPASTRLHRRDTNPDQRRIPIGCRPPKAHQHRSTITGEGDDDDRTTGRVAQVARRSQEAITAAMRTWTENVQSMVGGGNPAQSGLPSPQQPVTTLRLRRAATGRNSPNTCAPPEWRPAPLRPTRLVRPWNL